MLGTRTGAVRLGTGRRPAQDDATVEQAITDHTGRTVGFIELGEKVAGPFTGEDEEILRQLAQLAGVAIHSAQVRDALRQSEDRLKVALEAGRAQVHYAALNADIGVALTRGVTMREMLQHCAEAVVAHMEAAFARVWTLDPSGTLLELQASAGMYTQLDGPDSRIAVGKSTIGLIAQEGKPHLTNQIVGDPRMSDRARTRREGLVAFAGLPLIVAGQLVGVLAMFAKHPLKEEDFAALDGAARMVGLGIERKQTEAARDRALAEVAAERRRLEIINAELDQFAYVASHDLKAPLRGIANIAQWIQEDLQDTLREETRDMLDLMRSRMHRMEALIDGILQYSRAGRVRARPETISIGDLVGDAIELLAPPATMTLVVKPGMPTMITERLALQQVFMNLIGNAIKYTQRDDARVEIAVADAGPFYEFSVADNGPGIPAEYHERVWAIFQTLEPRDRVEGTGIGLSLVKKIVEMRGGRVWLESIPGRGTTFRFHWPKFAPREDWP
jgi:signal transduction histidine kinase